MQTGVFQYVRQPYKKAFKQYRDKLYKTVQTKQIEFESDTYVLIGQMRLKQLPLISHFDVFDDAGQSADERIGRRIHDFISILLLSKYFRNVKVQLDEFLQFDVQIEDINKWLNPVSEEDRIHLEQLIGGQVATLDAFIENIDHVLGKERWNESDIIKVERHWTAFWEKYEKRATAVFDLYEKNIFSEHPSNEIEAWIISLEKEAKIIHQVQMALTPVQTDKVRYTLQELISLNYYFGRMKQQDTPIEKDNKMERALYGLVNGIYRASVWILIPLILIGSLSTDDDSLSLLRLFIFPLIAISLRGQIKQRLIAKNNTYLMELREDQLTEAYPEQSEEGTKTSTPIPLSQSQEKKPILYDTSVLSIDIIRIFVMFIVVLFSITIVVLFQEGFVIDIVMKYLLLINVLLMAFTLWVPYSPLARSRFIVTDRAVQFRKEKIGVLEVKHIVIKGEGKDVNLFVTFHSSPYKLRVSEGDREPLKATLKTWCTSNRIPFKDKDAGL